MTYDDEYDQRYESEVMGGCVEELANSVIGRRIVRVEKVKGAKYHEESGIRLTLDNGDQVNVWDTDDCCAYTQVSDFRFLENVDNVITSVTSDDGFEKWFVYAGAVPVLEMDVDWSPGNPYYYGFGFSINVEKKENN